MPDDGLFLFWAALFSLSSSLPFVPSSQMLDQHMGQQYEAFAFALPIYLSMPILKDLSGNFVEKLNVIVPTCVED